jgi:hypothetical protein
VPESLTPVVVAVEGFTLASFEPEDSGGTLDELRTAADDIASDVGMALCSLGSYCQGGVVTVTVGGYSARSDD